MWCEERIHETATSSTGAQLGEQRLILPPMRHYGGLSYRGAVATRHRHAGRDARAVGEDGKVTWEGGRDDLILFAVQEELDAIRWMQAGGGSS